MRFTLHFLRPSSRGGRVCRDDALGHGARRLERNQRRALLPFCGAIIRNPDGAQCPNQQEFRFARDCGFVGGCYRRRCWERFFKEDSGLRTTGSAGAFCDAPAFYSSRVESFAEASGGDFRCLKNLRHAVCWTTIEQMSDGVPNQRLSECQPSVASVTE